VSHQCKYITHSCVNCSCTIWYVYITTGPFYDHYYYDHFSDYKIQTLYCHHIKSCANAAMLTHKLFLLNRQYSYVAATQSSYVHNKLSATKWKFYMKVKRKHLYIYNLLSSYVCTSLIRWPYRSFKQTFNNVGLLSDSILLWLLAMLFYMTSD